VVNPTLTRPTVLNTATLATTALATPFVHGAFAAGKGALLTANARSVKPWCNTRKPGATVRPSFAVITCYASY